MCNHDLDDDKKIIITLTLSSEDIALLQKTPLLKSRFGRSFEQTLQSYLEMIAGRVDWIEKNRSVEERRKEIHLVGSKSE